MKKKAALICVHNSCRSQMAEAIGNRKLIDEIPEPDIAISMGCDVGCPFIGRAFDDDWGLSDPTGKDDEEFRKVISEIELRLKQLVSL